MLCILHNNRNDPSFFCGGVQPPPYKICKNQWCFNRVEPCPGCHCGWTPAPHWRTSAAALNAFEKAQYQVQYIYIIHYNYIIYYNYK